jgi:hypothetical protein
LLVTGSKSPRPAQDANYINGECKDHVAPIEKALIDLLIEASKLQLMDTSEYQRILDNALASGLMQLPVLFGYAETKREKIESMEITH